MEGSGSTPRGGWMKASICTALFAVIMLASCSPATVVPTYAPFPAAVPQTATPTPFAFVAAGTPVPVGEVGIGLDNLASLAPLARWGKGRIIQVAVSPDGKQVAVATPLGIYLYDESTLAAGRFIEVKAGVNSIAFSPDG